MARAISDILKELDAGYAPQRNVYNEQINSIEPAQTGEIQGLEQAKTDSFNQITQGANRRGMFYSGIPIAEQAKYVGATYLPALAGLKNRYLQQRFNLQAALAGLTERQYNEATKIRQDELDREERQRQWEQQVALEKEKMAAAEQAARASGGGGGGISFSGGGGGGSQPQVPRQQETLRQRWQREANAGDWNAQVALNYAGDDGRYDGPVNSTAEFDILRRMGIAGNYYVRASAPGTPTGVGGVTANSSTNPLRVW